MAPLPISLPILILSFALSSSFVHADLPRLPHRTTTSSQQVEENEEEEEEEVVNFLVVGDWGRKGEYNQSAVASQMSIIGDQIHAHFVISTGDNFYDDGLTGDHDPAFRHSFTDIYTHDVPWYAVLGNHDYRGDALAQFSPALADFDSRWRCLRSFVVDAGFGDVLMVDTTPFVRKYFTEPKDHTYDWRGVLPVKAYIAQLLQDLDMALKASRATWKIVVGHHPIRSAGHHGDTQELLDLLLPILRAKGIDLYINGHDHCLEHISDPASGIQYLTSGGGSKAWRGGYNADADNLKFYYDGQGFMSVQLTRTRADVAFYDVHGSVLHKWSRSKNLDNEEMLHPIL